MPKILKTLLSFFVFQFLLGVEAGSAVTFSISAGGPPPYTYQWRKNGTPIYGATGSTYVATEPGDYDCLVTDGNGIVTTATDPLGINLTFEAVAPSSWNQTVQHHNDGSFVPSITGGAGGEQFYCIAGITNWKNGSVGVVLDDGEYDLYVATKCAPGYTGNAWDPIQGDMMVNETPVKLCTDGRYAP